MKRFAIYITFISFLFQACNRNGNKNQMLLGTWHSIKIDNPDVDSFFINSQKYIDTVGKGNDSVTNMMLYGVSNMDSMRKVLQEQYDSVKIMQMKADTQTLFTFAKDSVTTLIFPDRTETGKWYFDKDGSLVLEGSVENGVIDKAKVEVVTLTETDLRLKFVKTEDGVTDTSYVAFRRERK